MRSAARDAPRGATRGSCGRAGARLGGQGCQPISCAPPPVQPSYLASGGRRGGNPSRGLVPTEVDGPFSLRQRDLRDGAVSDRRPRSREVASRRRGSPRRRRRRQRAPGPPARRSKRMRARSPRPGATREQGTRRAQIGGAALKNSAVVCNGGRAQDNRVSTSPCLESRTGGVRGGGPNRSWPFRVC